MPWLTRFFFFFFLKKIRINDSLDCIYDFPVVSSLSQIRVWSSVPTGSRSSASLASGNESKVQKIWIVDTEWSDLSAVQIACGWRVFKARKGNDLKRGGQWEGDLPWQVLKYLLKSREIKFQWCQIRHCSLFLCLV